MLVEIPVDLQPGAPGAAGTELHVELDLARIAGEAGIGGAVIPDRVEARLPDGTPVAAQLLAGSAEAKLALALPAGTGGDTPILLRLAFLAEPPAALAPPRVVFSQGPDSVEILLDGARFAVYRYNTTDPELPRPYFDPIVGPTGVPITQDGEFPGEKRGHVWHTGLVLAHQSFTGGNNWQTGAGFSRMRHLAFDVMQSGPVLGRFTERLEWPDAAGSRVVFREVRTVTVPLREPGRRTIDVDTTVTCGDQPATWNATPYHLLAIRVPDAMLVKNGGLITNSDGAKNPADGVPAAWMDYSGPLNGPCGVAIMDHPQNLRHPVPWLQFAQQTFGAAPTHREPYAWKPGESLRFRYRVLFHAGDAAAAHVADEYAAWTAPPKARVGAPRMV